MTIRLHEEDKNRKGLVRVVIAVADRYSGCLSTDQKHCDEHGNVRAVGFWHRHDDRNLEEILSEEATLILDAYGKMWKYSGAIIDVEWKDYRK